MVEQNFLTLEEGCNKYLDNCRARNLREGMINHYRQSYVQFYKYFGKDLLVKDIDEKVYQKYLIFLRETLHNDVSINAYLRDFITTMHFLMREGYVAPFRMQAIKVDRLHARSTRSDVKRLYSDVVSICRTRTWNDTRTSEVGNGERKSKSKRCSDRQTATHKGRYTTNLLSPLSFIHKRRIECF